MAIETRICNVRLTQDEYEAKKDIVLKKGEMVWVEDQLYVGDGANTLGYIKAEADRKKDLEESAKALEIADIKQDIEELQTNYVSKTEFNNRLSSLYTITYYSTIYSDNWTPDDDGYYYQQLNDAETDSYLELDPYTIPIIGVNTTGLSNENAEASQKAFGNIIRITINEEEKEDGTVTIVTAWSKKSLDVNIPIYLKVVR